MVDLPGFKGMSFSSEYWGTGFSRRKLRALWITVVVLSLGALVPLVIYLFYQDHTSARQVILVLGSIFTFLAVPTTLYGIWQHVSNYTQPLLQRYIIRILWMVPIYALDSWIVLLLTRSCLAKYAYVPDMITLSYEAYTVYNFFEYLIKYLEITSGQTAGELLESKHMQSEAAGGPEMHQKSVVVEHLPPFRLKWGDRIDFALLDPWPIGEVFVSRCKYGVMSYILFSPIYLIVSISYESVHADVAEKRMFQFSSVLFYFTLAQSAISVWAVYCLVLFYHEARNELRPIKPLGKFLSIKGIVFVTFWQSIVLQWFGSIWIDEKGDIYDKHHGLLDCPYSKFHVTQALNSFLLCIEMFVLSFAFAFSFPSSEFKIPIDATGFMLDDEDGGDVTVLPRSTIRPKLRALFDIGDVSDDIREHTMRAGEEIGNGVARSFKVFWRKTTMFVRRAFGYDRWVRCHTLLETKQNKSRLLPLSLSLSLSLSLCLSLFKRGQSFTSKDIFIGCLILKYTINLQDFPQSFFLRARRSFLYVQRSTDSLA